MTHPNPSTALASVIVDQLAAAGVSLTVISPGSRSAALAIAAAAHPELTTRVVIDERSAGFHALGAARATGRPAVVISTSGSAVANYFPAVVEADMACVPLIVLSADRPAELQGIGANQTIDQIHLFGSKVRGSAVIEAPDADIDRNREWRLAVSALVATAKGDKPGPVHLNVRFREPTVPVSDDGRIIGEPYPFGTARLDLPGERDKPVSDALPRLAAEGGLVIAGDGEYDRRRVAELAEGLGWPVLATAMSGMRGGNVVGTYHHLLAGGVPDHLTPKTVVAVGATGPSTRLDHLFSSAPRRIRIDRWGRRIDPHRDATHVLTGDVTDLLEGVVGVDRSDWAARWTVADRERRAAIDEVLSTATAVTGPGVASVVNDLAWEALVVASSLPIRDVDAHLRRGGDVFANRGASGIDGFVSTALGVAGARPGTLALAGDLSLLHDSNGFINDESLDATFIVVDNGGGGLFDQLPQAVHAPDYERLFVTDPDRDISLLARLHHLRYSEADDVSVLARLAGDALAAPGLDLIAVKVDRRDDLAIRAQLDG